MDYDTSNAAILDSFALAIHNRADSTQRLYRTQLRRFADWLKTADRPGGSAGDLLAVARSDIEAYLVACAGLAPNTRRSRWVALRTFYGWAADEAEVDPNPILKVKAPPKGDTTTEILSGDQLAALFKACAGTEFLDRRDLALFRFLAATGLRCAECTGLAVGDIDLTNRLAFVRHGKGDRARVARYDAATAAAMDRYKRARARQRLASSDAWWLSRVGPLTPSGVRIVLARRADMAGLGAVHPHMLRHTFADRYLSAGGNEGDLQRLGGWESAAVMRRYGAVRAVDRALAGYDNTDPMSGL